MQTLNEKNYNKTKKKKGKKEEESIEHGLFKKNKILQNLKTDQIRVNILQNKQNRISQYFCTF